MVLPAGVRVGLTRTERALGGPCWMVKGGESLNMAGVETKEKRRMRFVAACVCMCMYVCMYVCCVCVCMFFPARLRAL